MPDLGTAAVVFAIVAAVAAFTVFWLRLRRRPGAGDDGQIQAANRELERERIDAAESGDDSAQAVLALLTEREDEVYLFGPAEELDGYGSTLATAPLQLTRYAAGLRVGADSARSFGELSGRLVMVDSRTAAAMRAGTMVRDKAGEILAIAKRADGKLASVARLRQVGGLAASAASLTNALSAMALQAQLDRIERQLSAISDEIGAVNRELLREWHAQALGAQDMLREVYSTANRAGDLTPSNWGQIASIGQVVRTQINGDRSRLSAAVTDLERLAVARDLKQRMTELDSKVDAVTRAHAALTESTRTWAQYSALRLWHFTVTGDPTTEAYRHELQAFIESSHESVEPLRGRALGALRQAAQFQWNSRARHPFVARRLPAASQRRLAILEQVNWQPLELRPPSKDLVRADHHD